MCPYMVVLLSTNTHSINIGVRSALSTTIVQPPSLPTTSSCAYLASLPQTKSGHTEFSHTVSMDQRKLSLPFSLPSSFKKNVLNPLRESGGKLLSSSWGGSLRLTCDTEAVPDKKATTVQEAPTCLHVVRIIYAQPLKQFTCYDPMTRTRTSTNNTSASNIETIVVERDDDDDVAQTLLNALCTAIYTPNPKMSLTEESLKKVKLYGVEYKVIPHELYGFLRGMPRTQPESDGMTRLRAAYRDYYGMLSARYSCKVTYAEPTPTTVGTRRMTYTCIYYH